mmetsp:Transcript_90859/g.256650  ORF Transcript_90859/g.256650 Transcript_90859/m.256650 type:complete len:237 (-) Transcript_90859:339-1049(-)
MPHGYPTDGSDVHQAKTAKESEDRVPRVLVGLQLERRSHGQIHDPARVALAENLQGRTPAPHGDRGVGEATACKGSFGSRLNAPHRISGGMLHLCQQLAEKPWLARGVAAHSQLAEDARMFLDLAPADDGQDALHVSDLGQQVIHGRGEGGSFVHDGPHVHHGSPVHIHEAPDHLEAVDADIYSEEGWLILGAVERLVGHRKQSAKHVHEAGVHDSRPLESDDCGDGDHARTDKDE